MCFDNLNLKTINVEVNIHRFFPNNCDFTQKHILIDYAYNVILEAGFKLSQVARQRNAQLGQRSGKHKGPTLAQLGFCTMALISAKVRCLTIALVGRS